ncbi:MAG: hypothetical protein NTX78_03235 [Rhodoluna sp.]|nr:hypothetical protein [Rhodoluna sp.]
MIRIGLVDSNDVVRSGRAMMITSQPDLKLVFEESDPRRALVRAPEYLVDVLIVSQNQHGYSGSSFVSELVTVLKSEGNQSAVLVSSSFSSDQLRWNAILAGAADLISLEETGRDFLGKIRAIAKRDYIVDSKFLQDSKAMEGSLESNRELTQALERLDQTQRTLLGNFKAGLSDFENARKLDVAKLRVSQLIGKLMEVGELLSRNQLAIVLRDYKL